MPVSHASLNGAFVRSFVASTKAAGLSHHTISTYEHFVMRFAAHIDRSLTEVTRGDIEDYVVSEMARTSASSASVVVRSLRRFYAWLLTEDEIDINPAIRVTSPRVPEPVTRIASDDDVKRLLDVVNPRRPGAATVINLRARALIHTLRSTGARIGEVARIKIEDINLDQGIILIPLTKGQRPRVVALDADAVRALSGYLRRIEATEGVVCGARSVVSHWPSMGSRRASTASLSVQA